jgi:hypothetical protein
MSRPVVGSVGVLAALWLFAAFAGASEHASAEVVVGRADVVQRRQAHDPIVAANDTCSSINMTFVSLANICIHSDHSGHCGAVGADAWNVVVESDAECRELCCTHPDLCAAYLFYESYRGTCCTPPGCHANATTPPSAPGAPCCWLKSAVGPAHLWSNDDYCSSAGIVYVPGPL